MTDPDLKKQLATVRVPKVDDAVRDRALHRATIALSQPAEIVSPDATQRFASRGFYLRIMGIAVLAVVVPAAAFHFRSNVISAPQVAAGASVGADMRTLAQVEELFPGQLNAVIERDGELQLDLSRQPQPGATEQPVLVQLESGGRRLRVLSYSGRSITLEVKGTKITFEALVTSEGGIVLSGDDFAWSSAQPKTLAGYRIQAKPLTAL